MNYDTKLLSDEKSDVIKAAELLKNGEVVGIPTETVYGLAADARNSSAVKKIFEAKGRPQDNPLIVHISDMKMIEDYVTSVPENARLLAEKFWPGPLTMILPKKNTIPETTSGGLDTVGIRMPSHPIARGLIEACGFPLAAPSANLSGSPSPTTAQHVLDDMNGRVPAIIDGGECTVGVESTVISFEGNAVRILRPGYISYEDLKSVVSEVISDKGILHKVEQGEKVLSPGMKYKHYSPKANVIIVEGDLQQFTDFFAENYQNDAYAMIFDADKDFFVPVSDLRRHKR